MKRRRKTGELTSNGYPLVFIEWEDSLAGTSGWTETKGAQPYPVLVRSVGWLVYDGKDCKLLVSHLSEPEHANAKEQGCGDMTIPASCVKKLVRLQVKTR